MLFLFAEVFIHLLLFPLRLKEFYNPGQITGVLGLGIIGIYYFTTVFEPGMYVWYDYVLAVLWIHFALCITFLMTAIILCNWQEWSVELKMIATFMYAGFTFYSVMEGEVPTGITVGTIGFCALEVFIHTMFGIQMYQRFHVKGKLTIYGPGSITAYFGFGVFGVILCYQMVGRTITVTDWIVAALVVFVGVGIVCVLGPETIIKKRDNDYAFPSASYFKRFLK